MMVNTRQLLNENESANKRIRTFLDVNVKLDIFHCTSCTKLFANIMWAGFHLKHHHYQKCDIDFNGDWY